MDNRPEQPQIQPMQQIDPPEQNVPQLQVSPPLPPSVEPAKPKKSRTAILLTLIGLLLIGLGIAGGWYLFGRSDKSDTNVSQATTTVKEKTSTTTETAASKPEDVTSKIKTALASEYTLVDMDKVKTATSNQVGVRLQTNSPTYKTAGYTYYNTYEGGSSIYLSSYSAVSEKLPTATEAAIRTKITKIYTDLGLSKTDTYGSSDYGSLINVYASNDLVCTIEDPSEASSSTTASCGLISAYKDAAAALQPFAAALSSVKSTTTFGVPSIKDSKVSGYQTASISSGDIEEMGGHVELFYRKTTGSWQYFTGTQSELGCEKYTTTDLKNAYKGEPCWDTTANKDSTVQ